MSCEGRTTQFYAAASISIPAAAIFPAPDKAFEMIVDVARAAAPPLLPTAKPPEMTPVEYLAAKAREGQVCRLTTQLFARFRALGIEPPIHGKRTYNGHPMPKRDACFGFAALEETLQALERGAARTSWPKLAQEVMVQQERDYPPRPAPAPLPGHANPDYIKLDEFDGRTFALHGVKETYTPEDGWAFLLHLDGTTYRFAESAEDDYRSGLGWVSGAPALPSTSAISGVTVRAERVTPDPNWREGSMDGLRFVDTATGNTVIEVGTYYGDEYYPSFVHSFRPDQMSVNQP